MTRIDDRIRERAHRIWEAEGRPAGRADLHWVMARQIVAPEENHWLARAPCPPSRRNRNAPYPETSAREGPDSSA